MENFEPISEKPDSVDDGVTHATNQASENANVLADKLNPAPQGAVGLSLKSSFFKDSRLRRIFCIALSVIIAFVSVFSSYIYPSFSFKDLYSSFPNDSNKDK